MRAVRSLFVIAALSSVVWTTTGQAQDPRARARQLYTEAQALFQAGNYAQAEASFRAAYDAVPNPVVLRAIASAQEQQGNIAGAIQTLEQYLRDAPGANDRAEVEGRLQAFRQRPAQIAITSTPPGARIVLDGRDTGHVTPHEVTMSGGAHTIELHLEGYTATQQQFEAQAGTRARLEIGLDAAADPLGTSGGDQQHADDGGGGGGGGSSDPSVGVWVLAGIGAATLIAGTVFGFLALSEQSNFDTAPANDIADRGETFALVADISFGVAALSVIAAVVLYVVERASADSSQQAAIVAPFATRDGGGIAAQLRF
ncbi:MAG: PEGA domain-containing protein [Sandaracinaceae bacterium]|nr:PEGA domain-containing protein [Sandaracinaceae bacterium]